MSPSVGGGGVPGYVDSLDDEGFKETDGSNSPLDSSWGMGDGDNRGLFDRGREWDGLGVRRPEVRLVRTGRLSVPWNLTREPSNLPTTPSQ